jgi:hypothetical protein
VALTNLVGLAIYLAAALTFALLGMTLLERSVRSSARLANTMFAVWWLGIGIQQFSNGTRIVLAHLHVPLSLHVGLQFASFAAAMVGLGGLLYYLLFLHTGRSIVLWPIMALYAGFFGWYMMLIAGFEPRGLTIGTWSVSYSYASPPSPDLVISFLVFVVGPQLLAGLALVVLALRLPPSGARTRTGVVAAGVLLWFGSALLGPALGLQGDLWSLMTLLIPLLVGSSVLAVYRPPRWLRDRVDPDPALPGEKEATPT